MERIIYIDVAGDSILLSGSHIGTQGEVLASEVSVAFDESWEGLSKKLIWSNADMSQSVCVLLTEADEEGRYLSAVPQLPLADGAGCLLCAEGFILDGDEITKRARTQLIRLCVSDNPLDSSESDEAVTATLAEQLQAAIDAKAPAEHTHTGYADADHTHTGYAEAEHTHTSYADAEHTHTGYADAEHTHTGYAEAEHTHTGYADADHTHTGYAEAEHTHTGYAAAEHTHTGYAAAEHTHTLEASDISCQREAVYGGDCDLQTAADELYSGLGDKADADHTHTGYADTDHTHTGYADAEHTHTGYAEAEHTHTGYADADHTHTGYADADHTHTGYEKTVTLRGIQSAIPIPVPAYAYGDFYWDTNEGLMGYSHTPNGLGWVHFSPDTAALYIYNNRQYVYNGSNLVRLYTTADNGTISAGAHAAAHATGESDELSPADIGAASADHTHTGYADADHTHTGYADADHTHTGYADADHTHTGYADTDHTHTAAQVGAATTSHTHRNYAASSHTHTAASVGAAASSHTHTAASIGAAASDHTHTGYAAADHTHNEYALANHTHAGGSATPANMIHNTAATTVSALAADFNRLITALKEAGLMSNTAIWFEAAYNSMAEQWELSAGTDEKQAEYAYWYSRFSSSGGFTVSVNQSCYQQCPPFLDVESVTDPQGGYMVSLSLPGYMTPAEGDTILIALYDSTD